MPLSLVKVSLHPANEVKNCIGLQPNECELSAIITSLLRFGPRQVLSKNFIHSQNRRVGIVHPKLAWKRLPEWPDTNVYA